MLLEAVAVVPFGHHHEDILVLAVGDQSTSETAPGRSERIEDVADRAHELAALVGSDVKHQRRNEHQFAPLQGPTGPAFRLAAIVKSLPPIQAPQEAAVIDVSNVGCRREEQYRRRPSASVVAVRLRDAKTSPLLRRSPIDVRFTRMFYPRRGTRMRVPESWPQAWTLATGSAVVESRKGHSSRRILEIAEREQSKRHGPASRFRGQPRKMVCALWAVPPRRAAGRPRNVEVLRVIECPGNVRPRASHLLAPVGTSCARC